MVIRSKSPVCSVIIEQKEGTDMTKVDIFSGFLGAGKTTLIKKLVKEVFAGKKIVLIENEFGEIGIDGGFLKDAGINITEMNSGCICCSLVGDFGKALKKVADEYHPDRIIIEPSGVGKLSDVRAAVENVADEADLVVNALVTVADASKIKMYMKNFGEFYNNQIENAGAVILSRTQKLSEEKQLQAAELIREKNPNAVVITTPWDELTGEQLTFENVVVCFADMDAYAGDSHDVQEVQYIKGGDAYLFTRGGVQVGRWEKTYPTNPLKLYTKSGEEMTLNRGKTYFALVDNDELSNFSYQ